MLAWFYKQNAFNSVLCVHFCWCPLSVLPYLGPVGVVSDALLPSRKQTQK